MRKYLSGVSQSMVAAVIMAILAPLANRFLPGSVFKVALGTVVAILLWAGVLVAIISSFTGLLKIKTQIVRLLDSRCTDLMELCESIRTAHPTYAGSLAAPTYLPNANADEAARAAIHKLKGRLKDFSDDLELVRSVQKLKKIKAPNPTGSVSDVKEALLAVHHQFGMWLF